MKEFAVLHFPTAGHLLLQIQLINLEKVKGGLLTRHVPECRREALVAAEAVRGEVDVHDVGGGRNGGQGRRVAVDRDEGTLAGGAIVDLVMTTMKREVIKQVCHLPDVKRCIFSPI